jgi:hypothetical protein
MSFPGFYAITSTQVPPPEGDFYITIKLDLDRFDALFDALLLDNNPIVDASNFDALAYTLSLTDPTAGGGIVVLETVSIDVDINGLRLGYNVTMSQSTTIEITATGTLYIL